MERESTQHGPAVDDELKHEVEDQLRAGGPTHAEEFRDPEMPDAEESADLGLDQGRREPPTA
ncbi:hypothetical protein [Saccharothrix sp.]|uniref:hypothetical protein n=1 Tax=Saccharothrix sp. TaxID=1873460 RepID=UPI0028117426|nr:hypothetical protein [Saccharothrix sp.]